MKFFKYILIVAVMLACAGTTHAVLYSDAYIYNAVYDSIYNSLVTTPPSAISPVGSRGATKLTLNAILNRIYDPTTKSLRIAAIGGGGGGSDTVSFSWYSDTADYATSANATKILDYSIDFSGHTPALNDVLEFDGTKWVASAGSQNYFRRAVLDTAFAGAIVDSILEVRGKITMTSNPIVQVFSGDGARMFAVYDDSTAKVSGGLYAQWLTLGTPAGKLTTWYTDEGFFAYSIPPTHVKPFIFSFNEWGTTDTAFVVSKDSISAKGNFHLRGGAVYLDNDYGIVSADTSGNIGWATSWLILSDEVNRTVLNMNDEFRLGTYDGYYSGNYVGKTHWKVSAFENHTTIYDSLTLGIEASPNEALLRMGTYIGTLDRWYHSADSLFAQGNRPRRFIGATVLDTFKGYYSGIVDSAKGARNANLLGSTISVSNTGLPGSLITIAVANGTSFIGGSAPIGSIGINNNVAAFNRLYIRYGVAPTHWGEIPYIRSDGSWSKVIPLADTSNWTKTLQGRDSSYYLSRANHLGTQAISTITGLPDSIAAKLPLHAQADSAAIADSSATTAFAWTSIWSGLFGVPTVITNIQDSLNRRPDTTEARVHKLIAGSNITLSPTNGQGDVTVSATDTLSGSTNADSVDHQKVTAPTPSLNDVLTYNGSAWVNSVTVQEAINADSLGDGLFSVQTLNSPTRIRIALLAGEEPRGYGLASDLGSIAISQDGGVAGFWLHYGSNDTEWGRGVFEVTPGVWNLYPTHADSALVAPWSGLTGVPGTFPPSSHTQAINTITGLQDSLDIRPDTTQARVHKLIAGTNVTLSPTNGQGDVTINATGGGSSTTNADSIDHKLVTAPAPASGNVLRYNGSAWVNVAIVDSALALSGFVQDSVAFSANYRKAVYIAGLTAFAIPTITFNVPCVSACSLLATPDSLIIRTYKMTTLGVWDTSATTGECYYRVKK